MAWADISADLQMQLINTRKEIGLQRQSEMKVDFGKLAALFDKEKRRPFDRLDPTFIEQLNNCSNSFREGGHWKTGDLSKGTVFYRIETMESFIRKHARFFYKGYDVPGAIPIDPVASNDDKIFDQIRTRYCKSYDWQPMQGLVSHYFSYRGFSWWTNDFNFEQDGDLPKSFEGNDLTRINKWLLQFAFKVGICTDWLSRNMLFMRLDCGSVGAEDVRIPSIIDALLQPVFSPRTYNQQYRWGLAFDLNSGVRPVYREYVIRNIPVTAIDYIPVRMNLETIKEINGKAWLVNSLVNELINNI